jgi:hypothetical protein
MSRVQDAAAALPAVARLAEENASALRRAFRILDDGALVGPAAGTLFNGLFDRHRLVLSAFSGAFGQVERLASTATPPPKVAWPRLPGLPSVPRQSAGARGGDPELLHQLGVELGRAGRSWEDTGRALAGVLNRLGLSPEHGQTIGRTGGWLTAQKADLERRRDELLKSDADPDLGTTPATALPQVQASGSAKATHSSSILSHGFDLWWNHYLPGVGNSLKELGQSAAAVNPASELVYMAVDFEGWKQHGSIGMAKGGWYGINHPTQLLKAVVNWDEWKKDPVRAYGSFAPDIVTTAMTFGSGGATAAARRAAAAAAKLSKLRKLSELRKIAAAGKAGEGLEQAASGAAKVNRLKQLVKEQAAGQKIAKRHGVKVDYTTRPIDPANAAGFNKAMARMAREYPSVFDRLKVIKVQDLEQMRRTDPGVGGNITGYSINDDRGPVPRGLYFFQQHFANKATTDALALQRAQEGWSVPGGLTAEGTFYHEFGHQIGQQIIANPKLRAELAQALEKAGVPVDESLNAGVIRGKPALGSGLSQYGSENSSEMIAEAFAEWKLAPHPRPIASTIGKFIDDHYRGK